MALATKYLETKYPEWEQRVNAEIEQTRTFLGVSRVRCSLSDLAVARILTVALILAGLVTVAATGVWRSAGVIGTLVTFRIIGALFPK